MNCPNCNSTDVEVVKLSPDNMDCAEIICYNCGYPQFKVEQEHQKQTYRTQKEN